MIKINKINFIFYIIGALLVAIVLLIIFLQNKSVEAQSNSQQACGNGVCQVSQGENVNTCPQDCGTISTPTPTPTTASTPTPTTASTPTPTTASTPTPTTASTPTPTTASTPTPTTASTPTPTTASTPTPTTVTGQSTPTPTSTGNINPTTTSGSSTNSKTTTVSDASYSLPSLVPYSPDPTNDATPTLTGTISVQQGTIKKVEYSLDNGITWIEAQPLDGDFNSPNESFKFTTNQLADGNYNVLVRGSNSEGVYTKPENYASDQFTLITSPPQISINALPTTPISGNELIISAEAKATKLPVDRVEVSLDGGRTWRAMVKVGNKYQASFSNLEDNNYSVVIRALDTIGNTRTSSPQTVIVDSISPIVGGGLFSVGPQIINPDLRGIANLVVGSKNQLEISMRGGPIDVKAITDNKEFKFQKILGTNNWLANITFKTPGQKTINITAIDGANNTTIRVFDIFNVVDSGKVLSSKNSLPIRNATVTLFYYNDSSRNWYKWDAESFDQRNPQITNDEGRYSYVVPPGKYYLDITASGYKRKLSSIFEVKELSIVNYEIKLNNVQNATLDLPIFGKITLSLSNPIPDTAKLSETSKNRVADYTYNKIKPGATIPSVELLDLSGKKFDISKNNVKNVLLSFIAPWSPPSLEQARILSNIVPELSDDQEIQVISLQETVETTKAFMKRGEYKFDILIDENGTSANLFNVSLLPYHFFIDKDNIIQEVHIGPLSENEALGKLKNMQ